VQLVIRNPEYEIQKKNNFKAIMAIIHACLYVSKSEYFVIPGICMSKTYAITMLMIFNNRMKISGGRLDQEEEEEECDFATTTLSRDHPQRKSRDASGRKTKIFVSNGRLTFQLAEEPPSPNIENTSSTSSESVRNVC
jgi:hypothetical protein